MGLALALPRLAAAQAPAGDERGATVCLGFSFGAWKPALDWKRAGHANPVDSARVPRAPEGRGWATPEGASADTTLMLFPPWWPVGVVVELPTGAPALGDTVAGRARALVGDGRRESPTSRVRAWRVACGR